MAFRLAPLADGPIEKVRTRHSIDVGVHDPAYRLWARGLGCCVTGVTDEIEFHHITIGRNRMAKREDDTKGVPVHVTMHSDQYPTGLHNGEAKFWNSYGISPFDLARDLYAAWEQYGRDASTPMGREILRAHREMGSARKRWGIKLFAEKVI